MDFEKLIPLIKTALANNGVTPEEVMAVMNKNNANTEDKDAETVDSSMIDSSAPHKDEQQNLEGKMLESTFKELEVEDAIEEAKENKALNSSDVISGGNNTKYANFWEQLKDRYAHNRRKNPFKAQRTR